MLIKAPAKINWYLGVLYKREDQYHELDMLMQQISLYDSVFLDNAQELSLSLEDTFSVPSTEYNIAFKAAKLLKEYSNYTKGANIVLKKTIPVGAGLAGGSADAAAVLIGLNKLWGLNYSLDKLCEIGLKIGADVPYCIRGGFARAQGVGEKISPLKIDLQYWLVVVQPKKGLSTKNVFAELDLNLLNRESRIEDTIKALQEKDFAKLPLSAKNDLQSVCEKLNPDIKKAVNDLKKAGARHAMMTGAGSAVYGVFASYKPADKAYKLLIQKYGKCFLCYTLK
ncbi:MAG: 4-(cytidine 5'-diphospho)-2-C-methyl-D-erythritol kinase [Eubacteriales bacterium]|nr:4-(cytidine 5'-diphospho)-2-C-methyl-D-erythritol kinase [Eubacteriales bacterium]